MSSVCRLDSCLTRHVFLLNLLSSDPGVTGWIIYLAVVHLFTFCPNGYGMLRSKTDSFSHLLFSFPSLLLALFFASLPVKDNSGCCCFVSSQWFVFVPVIHRRYSLSLPLSASIKLCSCLFDPTQCPAFSLLIIVGFSHTLVHSRRLGSDSYFSKLTSHSRPFRAW